MNEYTSVLEGLFLVFLFCFVVLVSVRMFCFVLYTVGYLVFLWFLLVLLLSCCFLLFLLCSFSFFVFVCLFVVFFVCLFGGCLVPGQVLPLILSPDLARVLHSILLLVLLYLNV